ncbi:MAG: PdxA family protein [Acidobacteriota bacterium]|nr:4-hydroxythreonine-4-phosphate dehydrogenase [Thermoanaerobaculaceae bacterium]
MKSPKIIVTVGDPGGIGPEILQIILTEKEVLSKGDYTVIGPKRAIGKLPSSVKVIDVDLEELAFHKRPHPDNGRIALLAIEEAVRRMDSGEYDLLVTGPVSKEAIRRCGVPFQGHTEYFANRYNTSTYMVFLTGKSMVALFTRHISLKDVPSKLSKDLLVEWILGLNEKILKQLKIKPKYRIMGLNPHAGEGGLTGREEIECILPAVEELKGKGFDIEGPFASDSFFVYENKKGVVAITLYHDQGMIPAKLLSKGHAVNLTLGLPYLRTSPDHGPAFDLSGKHKADPESFRRAILEGIKLIGKK